MIFYYDDSKNTYRTRYEATISPNPCWFYCYDKDLSQVPWTIEPQQSLSQLYRERAEWIRANYDYVVLAYSGGIDSTNVLESFYYNNIHIDEILCVGALSQEYFEGTDKNLCEDLYQNVFPTLSKLNLQNTKITIEDYTKYFNDVNNFDIIKKCGIEWYKEVGSYYSMTNWFWYELRKIYLSNKKTAIIFGTDKPYLFEFGSRLYTNFNDRQFFEYGNLPYTGPVQRVNFYTSPQSTGIIRKQLHMLMNIQKSHNQRTNTISTKLIYDSNVIKKLVYSGIKNPLMYQSGKSVSNLFSIRDMFMLNKKNSDIYKIYTDGLLDYQKNAKNININSVGFFKTKNYYIGDLI